MAGRRILRGAITARLKKRIAIAKANAGEKIRGAEHVRTGRMPKHEETAGLFSGFGGMSLNLVSGAFYIYGHCH